MSLLIKGGVTSFINLTDTPASYTGEAAKVAAVNTGEDALEFIDPPERAAPSFSCVEPQQFRPGVAMTWGDFDLSKLVPDGATGAIFHLINNDVGQERLFGLRKKDSIDNYTGCLKRNSHSWAIVGLDENKKCQGFCEETATADFLLIGYTGQNFTFFPNGYNIEPASKTTWVDTDLSSYCPGAIGAIIEFATHSDDQDMFGARKHGSTDDRHGGGHHTWMVVGLDANQHIDLYDEDWPTGTDAFNLIGYITAGVTFYTNADDIAPAADGAYHSVSLAGFLANPIIAFIELDSSALAEDWAIRKNWAQGEIYCDCNNHNFAIVHPNTPDALIDIKLSDAAIKLYLLGIG